MGRRLDTALRFWATWVVLFFSTGIKTLVNQVEGPFARSLVICDAEMKSDVYTGSRWCGDRLTVIQGGVEIQAMGQSNENMAMLCSLTFIIVITGIWGVKKALVLGLVGVNLSVGLFVLACATPELGRSLYTIAQGLQGVYPIEYLQGVIFLQLSFVPNMDAQVSFEIGSVLGMGGNIFWNIFLSNVVAMFELDDYFNIWFSMFALNSTILVLAIFGFPETVPMDAEKFIDKGPFSKVLTEVMSYKSIFFDWRARRLMVKLWFENMQSPYWHMIFPTQLMAVHGWRQSTLTWVFLLPTFLGLYCMPYFQRALKHFGHHTTYVWSIRYLMLCTPLKILSIPFTDKVNVFFEYFNQLLSGLFPFKAFVDSRFAEPEMMQRFQSVQWVVNYFEAIWVGPIYANVFDAAGWSTLGILKPGLVCLAAWAVHYLLIFHLIYDMDGVHGFGVTVRVMDELQDKASQLWGMVSTPEGSVSYEKWQLYNLEAIMGLPWDVTGGYGVHSADQWHGIMSNLNSTPAISQESLRKFDKAIVYAQGVHEFFTRAAYEQVAKATALWQMVAQEDQWISYEKWRLFHIEELLGLDWSWTGGQGVFSQEQWLGLFDHNNATEETLARLDYAISKAHDVHRQVAQAAIEQAHLAVAGAASSSSQDPWKGEEGKHHDGGRTDHDADAGAESSTSPEWAGEDTHDDQPEWAGADAVAEDSSRRGASILVEGGDPANTGTDACAKGSDSADMGASGTQAEGAGAFSVAQEAAQAISTGAADPAAEGKKDA